MHASIQALHQQEGVNCRGLSVTVYDPDTVVSPFNIGRQLFYATDLGLNKAEVLVGRVNVAYGTKWRAAGEEYKVQNGTGPMWSSRAWTRRKPGVSCTRACGRTGTWT